MRAHRWSLSFVALGLAACGGTDHIGPGYYGTIYSSGLVGYATPKGEMATEIRGNAPGPAEAIAARLRPPGWLPPFRFTTHPLPQTPSGYRVVLHFDPAAGAVSGERVCRGERSPDIEPPPEQMRIQAVFCAGDRFASEANGYVARPQSVDDPRFLSILDHLMATLLPLRNPDTERDRRCWFLPC